MQISSNDMTGGQSFTLKVERQPDGLFKATTPNVPELGHTLAEDRQTAVCFLNDRIQKYIENGYRVTER